MSDVEFRDFPGVSIVFDTRYFPIVVVTWFGVGTVEISQEVGTLAERVAERARAEDTAFIIIVDTTRLTAKTDRAVNEVWIHYNDKIQAQTPGRFLGCVAVVEHRLIRAIFSFLLKKRLRTVTVPAMADAIRRAQAALIDVGVIPPDNLSPDGYHLPTLDATAS